MSRDKTIYVRLPDMRVGVLQKIDSSCTNGKYKVLVKGDGEFTYSNEIDAMVDSTVYDDYDPKPAKQPAKRGGKK